MGKNSQLLSKGKQTSWITKCLYKGTQSESPTFKFLIQCSPEWQSRVKTNHKKTFKEKCVNLEGPRPMIHKSVVIYIRATLNRDDCWWLNNKLNYAWNSYLCVWIERCLRFFAMLFSLGWCRVGSCVCFLSSSFIGFATLMTSHFLFVFFSDLCIWDNQLNEAHSMVESRCRFSVGDESNSGAHGRLREQKYLVERLVSSHGDFLIVPHCLLEHHLLGQFPTRRQSSFSTRINYPEEVSSSENIWRCSLTLNFIFVHLDSIINVRQASIWTIFLVPSSLCFSSFPSFSTFFNLLCVNELTRRVQNRC